MQGGLAPPSSWPPFSTALLVDTPVGITSVAVGINICEITAKLKSIDQ